MNILSNDAFTYYLFRFQLLMGLFKLGFVTIYLSYPLSRGLTTAASIYVFTSQIKHIFGIRIGTYNGALKLFYVSLVKLAILPLPLCLSGCLSVCLSARLSVCISVCLHVCLSVSLSVCLSVSLSLSLSL